MIGSFPALSLADARSEWRNDGATRELARGDEQCRILERESLPEIGSVLLADLKPLQVKAAVAPIRERAPRRQIGCSRFNDLLPDGSCSELGLGIGIYRAAVPSKIPRPTDQ